MRIVSIRFGKAGEVPALKEALKTYANEICIAYKESPVSGIKVITTSQAVVDLLLEIIPHCFELTNATDFIKDQIHGYKLTNSEFLKSFSFA